MRSFYLQRALREYVTHGYVDHGTRRNLQALGVTSVELEQYLAIASNGA